jgi:hypothetical protein
MQRTKINPSELSEIRRAAAAARWQDHAPTPTRTIRLRTDLIARLQSLPGASWSAKIEQLLVRSKA